MILLMFHVKHWSSGDYYLFNICLWITFIVFTI